MDTGETVGKRTGRHPHKALTDAFARNASGPGFYPDGNGLYLKVDKSGARRWVQRLLIRGQRRDIALGSFALVSLSEAREAAIANRKIARSGGDPVAEHKKQLAIPTFEEVARTVHEIHLPSWRNEKHAAQFISTLETYAFPHMGRVSVADIGSVHIMAALLPIWLAKPETARRVRQRIGMVMKWAMAQGWRADNPAEAVAQALPKQDASQKKHRKALAYDDVAGCIETIKASGANPITKLAFEYLVLTASRSIEVRKAIWSEIDMGAAIWVIPPERMKAKKEHRVPLSDRCLEILREAQALSGSGDLVFPGTRHNRPMSDATLLKLVRENGFDVHIHGFRASFKMWTQEQTNTPRDVSEAALAHTVKDNAEAAYARSDFFEKRRKLMARWALYVAGGHGEVISIVGGAL